MWFSGSLRNGKRAAGDVSGSPPSWTASPARTIAANNDPVVRTSRGLEEFFGHIHGLSGLTLLDLGGATQQNVSFITDLGHRLYSENFVQILNETFGQEGISSQSNPGLIEYFLKQTLDYPDGHFDGVLIWDVLEYLSPALLSAVVERLHKIVRPGSYQLAFFHADDKLEAVPQYTFRIQDYKVLQVVQRGARKPVQLFNNRSLERLFSRSEVKFFLTKDRLREVVVRA
jgi:2-polyprenyl-3-methyl-5-hydroxy-6-metoxy-1,4-benzoquinol methylase